MRISGRRFRGYALAIAVSVIIPSRDRAAYLRATLAALARQTWPAADLEVVVADDGSTDDTGALCAAAHPFRLVHVRLGEHAGFCPARPRNRGLAAATGDLAIFLDADVIVGPDFVRAHVAAHATGPCAVIGYTYGYPTNPSERTPERMGAPPAGEVLAELPRLLARAPARWQDGRERYYRATRDLADHRAPWLLFWANNVSVPRARALAIGGFDEGYVGWGVEDLDFGYRLGVPIALARDAWGVHYPHPLGDLAAQRAAMLRNERRFVAKHRDAALEVALWTAHDPVDPWPALKAVLDAPAPPLDPAVLRACGALLGADASARLLRWGPAGPGDHAAWLQPFGGGSPGALPLLGLVAPWPDAAFDGAIVHDRWAALPERVAPAIVAELARVARRAVVLLPAASRYGGRARWMHAAARLTADWELVRIGDRLAAVVTARR